MSSPLALAAVSATLCDLLNNGLIDNDLAPIGSFSVTALPPDRIETGANEPNRLNLFLYQVTPNPGWRNEGLPSHDARDPRARLSNPPLALDLHYLLTAYGSADFAAEILLGFAMELLHEQRVLSRRDIRNALSPNNPIKVALIPPDPQGRKAIDLAEQIEQIKVAPHYLSSEELARLWTAMQARFRPTMAYQVTTVLIQGARPTRTPLPVVARGEGDRGVSSQPSTQAPPPSVPTLLALTVVPATGGTRGAAEQGDVLELTGALLSGDTVTAEFRHAQLLAPLTRPLEAGAGPELVRIVLPQGVDHTRSGFSATAADDWPAGNYTVGLRIERAGKPVLSTNQLSFGLAPRLSAPPKVTGSASNLRLTLNFFPKAFPGQRIQVFVGADPFAPAAPNKTGTLALSIKGVTPAEGKVPVRLRIDGVDSELVRDRSLQPPQFDPQQCVTLPT